MVTAVANDSVVRSVRGAVELGASVGSEPPWPEFPRHQAVVWQSFMSFPGPLEAHILAGRLNVEGVPTIVLAALAMDLSNASEILVPRSLMHRARWVLAWPPIPEEELLFLATGELGPGGDEQESH